MVKVGAATRAMGMGDDERDVLAQFLGMKVDGSELAEADPQAFKARAFEALRQLTIRRSRQGPLVVLLEDVHWIDRASEEYFASLVDALVGARIILVCTYRAGYRPPWIDKSFATQMALQPLGLEDGLSLARSTSGRPGARRDAARDDRRQGRGQSVLRRGAGAGGARAGRRAHGRGAGHHRGGAAQPPRPPGARRISDCCSTPRSSAARCRSRCSSRWPACPATRYGPGSARLSSAEFLYELPRGSELEYSFKHALTHEVVYASLERAARRTLHAQRGGGPRARLDRAGRRGHRSPRPSRLPRRAVGQGARISEGSGHATPRRGARIARRWRTSSRRSPRSASCRPRRRPRPSIYASTCGPRCCRSASTARSSRCCARRR